jgi:lipopolysaccharide transport system permease protein
MRENLNRGVLQGLSLAWMLAKRDLRNRYAGSYAGVAWNIGVPLLYSVINVVVFSILMTGRMGTRYGDVPFSLFYFIPFTLWTGFAEVVGRSPNILKDYSYLINKIAFPAWVLPLIPLASAILTQLVILIISLGLMLNLNVEMANTAGLYIIIWLISLIITIGVAYAVAALSVYIPDLSQAIPVCITILFWLTPILYPATLVERNGSLWVRNIIMDYNPFYYLVELSRHAVFGSAPVLWSSIGAMTIVAFGIFGLGVLIFRKLQPGFADVI